MPLRIRDRVKQRTLTIGTGVITFSSSLSSFQDFSGVLSDGDLTYYTIQNTSQFEVGEATYSGNTLDRGQVFVSSSGSSRIYLNQEADVFITYPASKAVFLEIENNITGVDAFDFNTGVSPSYKQGRIFYDTDNGAIAVYNDEADITLQVGQEEYLRAKNDTTGVILNGEAVRVLGSQGSNPTIIKAIATGALQSQAIGVATHDIESNSFGYVTTYGIVRGIDTSDLTEGSEIYLSDQIAGGLTGVSPIAPSYKTSIGHVVRSHPSVGSILVTPRAEKLGGPDVKSTNGNNIGASGVTFVELLTDEGAAILASNTGMVYDSGNQILEINAGGIKYPDGQTQTIAYTGQTADLSSYATTSYVNSVSGNLQSQITSNDSDISTLQTNTGLLDIRVSQNETDIISLQNTDISLDARISQNETDIAIVSGSLYNNWNINVSGNVDSIASNQTVVFTGLGLTTVSYDNVTNTISISGAGDGGGAGGGYDWNVSVTGLSDTIASGDTVTFTGLGSSSILYNPSSNTVTISGADLSSYSTTSYVNTVSGNLQGEIDSNDTDISALQTATGLLDTDVQALQTSTGLLEVRVAQNETDITSLETATGLLDTRVTQNQTDITSVSGQLYNNWNINVTGNIDSIESNQAVIFTGIGLASVAYNENTNTVTISGAGDGGGYDWNISVTGLSDTIASGETIVFTGLGNTSLFYNASTNTLSISGADQDLSSYATTSYVDSVSGNLQAEIDTNAATSGYLQAQIDSNDTDISSLQTATGSLETRVTQNETDITALETSTGLLDTRVTQNDNDIDSVSGLLYNYWVLRGDGATTTNVDSTEQVQFKGAGSVSVSLGGTDNREVTISGIAPSGGGMTNWNLSVTGDSTSITQAETVTFSGQGNVIASRSGNFVIITGVDQDLSSYATTSFVNSVSGNLQSEIDSNDTDISELQTATGLLETRVTQNETDITSLETATGNLDTRVTQNESDINSVSGLLYNNWNINVTGNVDSITSNETVLFTGIGNTSVTYNSSSNIVSISGADQDLSSYATTAYVNSVSGNLQGEIDSNDTDISALQTATGLLETRVTQNETDITTLETATGLLEVRVTQNEADITALETATGLLDTRVTQNTNDISSSSGYLQGQINTNDTDISNLQTATGLLETRVTQNELDITALETATGNLDTRVTQNTNDISSVSGLLYNNWNVNVTGNIDSITSNETVLFTGVGNTSVTYNSSTNTVSISGTDQDLSSYATTAYVNSVSGNLQGEIDSNDTDIANLQTATGNLDTRVSQNETDITALETATGNLDTRVTQNTSDITSVSGLLYNNWKINVTGNIDDITSEQTVLFTGLGATSVTYNDSTNTVSISGAAGSYSWNVGVTGASDTINNGNTVTFTGAGQSNVTYNPSTNTVLISGVNGSAPTGNHSGIAYFGSNNLITENTDFTISDSGKVYSKVSFGSLDDQGNKSGTITFNAESSNLHLATLTGNSTLAITGEDIGQKILIRLQQDSVGGYIVNWWNNIKWAEGGTVPTLTTASGKADMFGFIVTSGNGPYFYDGFVIGQNI